MSPTVCVWLNVATILCAQVHQQGSRKDERNRAHLSPLLSLICTCVVGSFLSTSNWTSPLTGASGAFGLPISPLNMRVEPVDAGAGEGAGLDSGKGEPEPRRLPEPVNGPDGCCAWRVHFSLRRSAMRSSTGWSCLTLRKEMGARLCGRAVRSAWRSVILCNAPCLNCRQELPMVLVAHQIPVVDREAVLPERQVADRDFLLFVLIFVLLFRVRVRNVCRGRFVRAERVCWTSGKPLATIRIPEDAGRTAAREEG